MTALPEYMACCSINENSILRSGNERFYTFFRDNGYYPLFESVDAEDVGRYHQLLAGAQTEELSQDVLRLKDGTGKYHWVLFQVRKKVLASGEIFYDIWFQKIDHIKEELEHYKREMMKCRYFMGMLDTAFFEYEEYTIKTGQIQFYWIQKGRKVPIEKSDFLEWKDRCLRNSCIDTVSANAFEYFCHALKEKKERLSCGIHASFLNGEGRFDNLRIYGGAVEMANKTVCVMGRIQIGQMRNDRMVHLETINEKTDSLTGLLNKGETEKLVKKKLLEANGRGKVICMIDIDDFKQINDYYGHLFGDEVIKAVANLLGKAVDGKGICGRFGGDEFFILLEEGITEDEVRIFWRSVRTEVQRLFKDRLEEIKLSISVGISCYPKDGMSYKELFLKADRALYLAKEKGKNRYIIYDESRHGSVPMTDSPDVVLEFSKRKRVANKTKMMCDVIQMVSEKGGESIHDILRILGEGFAVDRVTITEKNGWKKKYQWSRTEEEMLATPYMEEEEYLSLFDENGNYACNYIMNVDSHSHHAYVCLQESGIYSMFQHLIRKKGEICYMISYDSCFSKRKWSDNDIHDLTIVNTILKKIL